MGARGRSGHVAKVVEEVEVKAPGKPLRPSQCRTHMRKELAAAYPEIVQGFIKGAKSGSCAHVKLAGELLEQGEKKRRRAKGSAEKALAELTRGRRS